MIFPVQRTATNHIHRYAIVLVCVMDLYWSNGVPYGPKWKDACVCARLLWSFNMIFLSRFDSVAWIGELVSHFILNAQQTPFSFSHPFIDKSIKKNEYGYATVAIVFRLIFCFSSVSHFPCTFRMHVCGWQNCKSEYMCSIACDIKDGCFRLQIRRLDFFRLEFLSISSPTRLLSESELTFYGMWSALELAKCYNHSGLMISTWIWFDWMSAQPFGDGPTRLRRILIWIDWFE